MKPNSPFLLENADWPAFLVNDSGIIARCNRAAAAMFGGLVEGKTLLNASIWSPDNESSAEIFLSRLDRSAASHFSLKFKVKDGASLPFAASVCVSVSGEQKYFLFQLLKPERISPSPAASTLLKPDLPLAEDNRPSSKKSARSNPSDPATPSDATQDSNAAHRQRLDCALQLTRTISLDFNNALTSILGHASFLLHKAEPGHPWRHSLAEIEKSAGKASEISQDLAAFSRQEPTIPAQVTGNLGDLLRNTVDLFQNQEEPKIEWALELEPRLYAVDLDAAKIQKALVKIIENSLQAVPGKGRIALRTRNHHLLQPLKEGILQLSPGYYVSVEVEDNGAGIAPDLMPRLFQPFFTTKKGAHHRGLGLSWVYGIVTNHRGSVGISSQIGAGTTVRIYLPARQELLLDAGSSADNLRGSHTILVVDDEQLVLTLAETVLSSFGYRVLTAANGQKALEILATANAGIDLVITDVIMPRMSGLELLDAIKRLAPRLPVITSSGNARPAKPQEPLFLGKPFTSQDLLRKVKQALSSPRAKPS